MKKKLNVAAFQAGTRALGPGRRFVLWVQGCPFSCKGCISPEWIPDVTANLISIDEMADKILNAGVDGVTFSGGEPFLQAGLLSQLTSKLKDSRPDLSFIAFTGYELHQLRRPEALSLIHELDLVITGKYVESLHTGRGLRGSENQELHFLTDRLKPFENELTYEEP